MTRVALVTTGISSILHASLELARRLRERRHEVTFICHVDVGERVRAHGHEFVHLTAPNDARAEIGAPITALRERRFGAAVAGLISVPATAWRARRETAAAKELVDALQRLEPGLLVIDTEAHVAIIALSRLGIPIALTTAMFCVTRHTHVPPLDTPLGPDDAEAIARAWAQTAKEARRARWRRLLSRKGLVDLLGPVSYWTASRVALRAVARHSGFDLAGRTAAREWLRPHHYRDLPTLTTNLWELEFDHEPPPNWHYVGPMVHADRARVEVAGGERWRSFARRRDRERPLVYCSLGSYWPADESFLSKVVDVFRRRGDWDLVLGLGGRLDAAAFDPTPPNVLVLGWAPQVEVLEAADAAMVHGGNASLNECVFHGVPMVVYSTGHIDQDGIAARVAHHGVGVVGDWLTVTPDAIEGLLEAVLGDSAIAGRVRELRDLARDPVRMARAVDLLEQIAFPDGRSNECTEDRAW